MELVKLETTLDKIGEILNGGKELVNEEKIVEFQMSSKEIGSKLRAVMEEGRVLRLGIVGEVKAGKSSFLNALLFDGKDILPKAPTPMTAALTRISYSDRPKGRIVFYDRNDWDAIVSRSRNYDEMLDRNYAEYKKSLQENVPAFRPIGMMTRAEYENANRERIPMEYRACKEVYMMAENSGIDIDAFLGQEKVLEGGPADEYGYLRQLNDYVGSDGKYTPIVKYTEIQICNEMLRGVEVIDTPGLNDPIYSRSRTTKKFLIECDAVFLLGYGGQYLGAEDMNFIMSSLPDEGIQKAVLVVSKFDAAILQYPKRKASFQEAYLGTAANCKKQAKDNIRACKRNSHNENLLGQIEKSLPPICISSLAYSAARQLQERRPYGEYEDLMIRNLKRFPDFTENFDTLMGLSNIPDVRKDVFEKTKAEKDIIIRDRIGQIVRSQIIRFKKDLENISIQASSNLSDLKRYDCDQLKEQLAQLRENLDSIRIVVKNLFEKEAIGSKRTICDMVSEVSSEMRHHHDIEVRVDTKTNHHSSTSGHLWWKKTHHWDEIVNTNIAEINDVERNIRDYKDRAIEMINDGFKNLLKIDELKDSIKATVMGAFERADKSFDENRILIPLDNALNRITFPKIDVKMDSYEKMLDGMLGSIAANGVVKDDNIPELKRAQDKVIARLSEDITDQMKKQGEEIELSLNEKAADFVDNIVKELKSNQEKLEALLQDKQAGMDRMESFIEAVGSAKGMLDAMGE